MVDLRSYLLQLSILLGRYASTIGTTAAAAAARAIVMGAHYVRGDNAAAAVYG